jgi:adenylate kinase family enzyme
MKKIYIIGPASAGKTTLAKKIQQQQSLPVLNLDNIFWQKKYTVTYTSKEKKLLLKEFLKTNFKSGWIIEGAPQDFLQKTSQAATKIIWLNPNIFVLFYRTIKRFIITKFFTTKINNQETLKSTYKIIKGIISYKLKNKLYHHHKQIYLQHPQAQIYTQPRPDL